jgi:predicted dehydrogenase
MSEAAKIAAMSPAAVARPKIGCVGVGWIGRHRMKSVLDACECDVVAIVEPRPDLARAARELTADTAEVCSFEEVLRSDVDGIMIATPSALHTDQSVAALEHGKSVFCQKPLGRNLEESRRAIAAARITDRLLCVDLSYRFVRGMQQIKELVRSGELGRVYVMELAFHNAYGPDKPWFYDSKLSGGGCLIDLGIHLVDLALWTLDFPAVTHVGSHLFSRGRRFSSRELDVEDYADANLDLEGNVAIHLACSWKAHAGRDAAIEVAVYGTHGGARWRNVTGSFYDFLTERFEGTRSQVLGEPPEDWGGRAAVDWLKRLCVSNRFDPDIEHVAQVAATLDRIYSP